jgi:hypothetical protein
MGGTNLNATGDIQATRGKARNGRRPDRRHERNRWRFRRFHLQI